MDLKLAWGPDRTGLGSGEGVRSNVSAEGAAEGGVGSSQGVGLVPFMAFSSFRRRKNGHLWSACN